MATHTNCKNSTYSLHDTQQPYHSHFTKVDCPPLSNSSNPNFIVPTIHTSPNFIVPDLLIVNFIMMKLSTLFVNPNLNFIPNLDIQTFLLIIGLHVVE